MSRAARWAALGMMALALPCRQARAQSAARYPAVTIAGTEVRQLHSQRTGRDYDIYVYLPSNYSRAPEQRYPVLYLTDAQWDFKLLTSIQGGLLYDRFNPEVMVVGITYPGANANYDSLRVLDLTTVPNQGRPGSGGGPQFLAFLKDELIPWVESNYRADPAKRALMGNSLGGSFALFAAFSEPGLFSGIVAGSPAVTNGNRDGFAVEQRYAAAHRDLPIRLFISVGELEDLAGPVGEYVNVVRGRNYQRLTLETRIIAGERHSSNKPEALNRGLRFVFGNR